MRFNQLVEQSLKKNLRSERVAGSLVQQSLSPVRWKIRGDRLRFHMMSFPPAPSRSSSDMGTFTTVLIRRQSQWSSVNISSIVHGA
jgi:hypothetical protein